ncbi:MAG: molybdate ABC transporter permease subunit [Pseudanabaenaceae cyanobacterium]|jgi:molybdate ABC transporter permease protein
MTVLPDLAPLWISLRVSFLATLIVTICGTVAAYKLYNYRHPYRVVIENIFLIPLLLPPTVIGFILLLLLGKNSLIGRILNQWELRLVFSWHGAVIAAAVVAFPLMYRAAVAAFSQIEPLLLDAARLDGASELTVFQQIALPLAAPGIIAGIILAFARALGEFGATLMLAGNIPGETQTIPIALYFAVESGDLNAAIFWVGTVLVLSILGVLGLEYWSNYQR